jgi:hypothetical protein
LDLNYNKYLSKIRKNRKAGKQVLLSSFWAKSTQKHIDFARFVGLSLRHTPWVTMITIEGIAKGKYSDMIQSQVVLDDLFV